VSEPGGVQGPPPPGMTTDSLSARVLAGDLRAVARAISLIENEAPEGAALVGRVFAKTGRAYLVGVTGPPGAGKSTLVDRLATEYRKGGLTVGIIAVDPTSPYSGGAILGDRVRMQDHATDPGVFIRSMATRGHLGGLALATPEAVRLLDALGQQLILIETVGVGQVEVEIAGKADTTIVVVNPGWGDSVQANKAGLMEVADIFVINKADRPGAGETRRDLEQMLDLAGSPGLGGAQDWPGLGSWRPPILATVATTGDGVSELWRAVIDHRRHAADSGLFERRRIARLREELGDVVTRRLRQRAEELSGEERWNELTDAVLAGELDPWAAADELLGPLGE